MAGREGATKVPCCGELISTGVSRLEGRRCRSLSGEEPSDRLLDGVVLTGRKNKNIARVTR